MLSGKPDEDILFFLDELPFVLHEVAILQLFNPFRKYMFWNKDVQRVKSSSKRFIEIGKRILREHRDLCSPATSTVNEHTAMDDNILISRIIKT